jgi:hypothetical protein
MKLNLWFKKNLNEFKCQIKDPESKSIRSHNFTIL